MRVLLLTAASTLSLGVAGCQPPVKVPTAQSRLDCPDKQGELVRVGIAPDGRACGYKASDGTEVTLRLTPLSGDAYATLAGVEHELQQMAAAPAASGGAAGASARAAAAAEAQAAADAGPEEDADADEDGSGGTDHAKLDLPGLHVDARDGADDDQAKVDLPGVHIDAQDEKTSVRIGGSIRVNADDEGATVKMIRDVRLRGEAFSRAKRGVRATYVLARSGLADGFSYVGYEAAGPKTGPLVVAVVKSRDHDHHGLRSDVKTLVRRNAGV